MLYNVKKKKALLPIVLLLASAFFAISASANAICLV